MAVPSLRRRRVWGGSPPASRGHRGVATLLRSGARDGAWPPWGPARSGGRAIRPRPQIRLAIPGMTTARSASMPATAALATSSTGTHMILGMASAASSSEIPAAAANPVATGPGTEHGHRRAGSPHLATQRVAVGEHEGLARPVGGLARQGLEGGRRCHVEHASAPALDHPRQEQGAQVHHRLDVGAHHGQLGGRVGPMDRAHGGEPGVVDQHVDRQRTGRPARRRWRTGMPPSVRSATIHLGPHAVSAAQLAGQLLRAWPGCGRPG